MPQVRPSGNGKIQQGRTVLVTEITTGFVLSTISSLLEEANCEKQMVAFGFGSYFFRFWRQPGVFKE
jgi:hypothetical protein